MVATEITSTWLRMVMRGVFCRFWVCIVTIDDEPEMDFQYWEN